MKKKTQEEIFLNILKDLEVIQLIPSPTFQEKNRAHYVYQRFMEIGLHDVEIDQIGNVIAFLPGRNQQQKPILISAHLDTVHSENINHQIKKQKDVWIGPGIGDNSLALAALINLGKYFRDTPADAPLIFAANVGEEGLGNLCGMKALVDRFQARPLFYLVLEGIGLGAVFNQGLGVSRFQVTFSTPGGHSWGNFGQPSAIHELAKFISTFSIDGTDRRYRSSFNFGKINGGISVNSIASEAKTEMELRAENGQNLQILQKRLYKFVDQFQNSKVKITIEKIGERPYGELPAQHWLVQSAIKQLHALGIGSKLVIGSTDANYPLSLGFPAICLCITKGGNVHTANEFIKLNPIQNGFFQLVQLINETSTFINL